MKLEEQMIAQAMERKFLDEIESLNNGEMSVSGLDNFDYTPEEIEFIKSKVKIKSTAVNSYTWGLDCIDKKITTPKKGIVTVMVSDENTGKSTFCYFLARKNFQKYGHKVVYFNLEQTKKEVINYISIQHAGATKLQVRDNEHLMMPRYAQRKKELTEQEDIIFIGREAEAKVTIEEIKKSISGLEMDYLILDNLTCISDQGKDKASEINSITLKLISLSKSLQIPILLVHHYRKRDTKVVQIYRDLHDMEGSGVLKNLVPMVIQVARNPDPQRPEEYSEFYIREGKVRGGNIKESIVITHDKGEFYKNDNPFLNA